MLVTVLVFLQMDFNYIQGSHTHFGEWAGAHGILKIRGVMTKIGKGVRALRGYFGPPMMSKNKSCSSQVSSY